MSEVTDGKAAHAGGIYGVSWSPDGKQLLSASGDKTCKVWDVETRKVVRTFDMGKEVADQQLACLWNRSDIITRRPDRMSHRKGRETKQQLI